MLLNHISKRAEKLIGILMRHGGCFQAVYRVLVQFIFACIVTTCSVAGETTGPFNTWIELRTKIDELQKSVTSVDVRFQEKVLDATQEPKMSSDVGRWKVLVKGDQQIRVEEEGEASSVIDKKSYRAKRIVVSDGSMHKSYYPKIGNVYPAGFIDTRNETHLYSHVALLPIAVRYRMLEWIAAECPGLADDQFFVRNGTIDGKPCVIVSWNFRGLEREVYLDRARDLIASRVRITATDPKMTQIRVQWDIQYSNEDSYYSLDTWKYVNSDNQGHVVHARTAKVMQCTVNPNIADSSFRIEFPVGTYVEDNVSNEKYIVKENSQKRPVSTGEWESGATYDTLLVTEPIQEVDSKNWAR